MSHVSPGSPAAARVALVTGVGRRRSIGAELALGRAADGWDHALGHRHPYEEPAFHILEAADPDAG
jgi:3-oxoacyl-[acyl-carrier protein] reductase